MMGKKENDCKLPRGRQRGDVKAVVVVYRSVFKELGNEWEEQPF